MRRLLLDTSPSAVAPGVLSTALQALCALPTFRRTRHRLMRRCQMGEAPTNSPPTSYHENYTCIPL